jgi:peptidoglycan hydrolase-like amidase
MSLYGAKQMSKEGKDAAAILQHYYPNAQIKKLLPLEKSRNS